MKTVIYKLHSSWKWNFYHRQKCKNGKLLQMDLKVHINICCTLPHTHTHTPCNSPGRQQPEPQVQAFTLHLLQGHSAAERIERKRVILAQRVRKLLHKTFQKTLSSVLLVHPHRDLVSVIKLMTGPSLSHWTLLQSALFLFAPKKKKKKKKKFNHTQTQSTFSTFSHCRLTTVFCLNRFNPASPVFWWAHSTAGMQAKLKRVSQSCVIQRQCHYEFLTRLQRLHQCSAIPCNLYMHHLKLKIQTASVSIGKALNSEQIRHICSGFDMRRINAYLSVQSSFNILFLSRTSERIN